MNDNFQDARFQCGDRAALVTYLYDECEPHEREAIAAHVAACLVCAEEIEGLGATRRMLPAWTPPEVPLGFQVTSTEASAHVLRPARWWNRPLPAWAQAAAAFAIFAAGLAAGRLPGTSAPANAARDNTETVAVQLPPSTADPERPLAFGRPESAAFTVSREEMTRLETELRAQLARLEQAQEALGNGLVRSSSQRAGDAVPQDERVTMDRVQALIQESERRQRGELIWGMEQVLSDVDLQRRRLEAVQTTVEGLGKDTLSNRQSVSALANVFSTQGGFRPVSSR